MKTCIALCLVIAATVHPAFAQSATPLQDAAVRAAQTMVPAARPSTPGYPVLKGALIGAGAGAALAWFAWYGMRECGTCGPGSVPVVLTGAAWGAGIGALIGTVIARDRAPGIPLGRRAALRPELAKGRVSGQMRVTF